MTACACLTASAYWPLGHWFSDQRYKYRKGTLQDEKVAMFRDLGCEGFAPEDQVKSKKGSKKRRGSGSASRKQPQAPPPKPKPRPTRKRLGMEGSTTSPTAAKQTATRSGRAAKKMKSDGDDEYFFY